jgi:RNA polymerase primary sigma factor
VTTVTLVSVSRTHGAEHDRLLWSYLVELRSHPLLGRGDEERLGRLIELGREAACELDRAPGAAAGRRAELEAQVLEGQRATQRFIQANLRLVVAIAKRYRSSRVPLLDLIQEGNLGLMQAVSRYDYRHGCKFSTYAKYWITQAVTKAIADTGHPVRLPAQVLDVVWRIQRSESRLSAQLGRSPSLAEVAGDTHVCPELVSHLRSCVIEARSLSEQPPGGDDGDGELSADTSSPSPHDEVAAALVPAAMHLLLGTLDERERDVLRLHYGLGGTRPKTLAEIGVKYKLSRERIRQIEARSLEKLRTTDDRHARSAFDLATG